MNINRIKADIKTAETLCSPIGNPTNDEYIVRLESEKVEEEYQETFQPLAKGEE